MYPRWREDSKKFIDYVDAVLGFRPPGFKLARIDAAKGFYPGNLIWATRHAEERPNLGFNVQLEG